MAELKTKNVPVLRFPGFSDEWEVKKLGALLKIGSGRDYKHLGKGNVPVYGTGGVMLHVDNYLYDGKSIGIGRKGTIDQPQFLTGKFWTVDTLFYTRDYKDSLPEFVYLIFQKVNWKKWNEASGVPSLSKITIEKIKVNVPSVEEQKKIAGFLGVVDERIEKLERKVNLLQLYKKGAMQAIFSQEVRFVRKDGKDYPEWEEKKLDEITDFSKGKNISKTDINNKGTPAIRYGELYTEYSEVITDVISKTNLNKNELFFSKRNDVLIPSSGETAIDIATASCVQVDGIAIGGDINVLRTEENGAFLAYYLSGYLYKEMARLAQGNSVVHLYSSNLRKLKLNLPIKEEQQKIADFLTAIDDKIELTKKGAAPSQAIQKRPVAADVCIDMANQKIQYIKVEDLRLWTENPRDPINTESSDLEILKRAINENPKEWNLERLVKEMGEHYDFSEIPTVVYIDSEPVVFDGNRRVAVLKYLQNPEVYAHLSGRLYLSDGPRELRELVKIPCNVCSKNTALTNIERKHTSNGSWGIIQREYFLHYHRKKPKSLFLILDEQTGLIRAFPPLNQRFVKDEILTKRNLESIGLAIDDDKIVSNYSDENIPKEIFEKISLLIENKDITTRKNRGKLQQILEEQFPEVSNYLKVYNDRESKHTFNDSFSHKGKHASTRRTPITKTSDELFGRKLILEKGPVNTLYCGVVDVYEKFKDNEHILPILGMSLRLLLDVAGRIHYQKQGEVIAQDDQVSARFIKEAKSVLSQKAKNSTTLTLDWISGEYSLEGVLHKYAHGNIDYSKQAIVQSSKVVADILDHYFGKGNP